VPVSDPTPVPSGGNPFANAAAFLPSKSASAAAETTATVPLSGPISTSEERKEPLSKKEEKEMKKQEKMRLKEIKKKAKMANRLNFLGGKSAKVDEAVAKVSEMMDTTQAFEDNGKPGKPKLKGIALLRMKTKAMMMQRKLAQLKANIAAANAAMDKQATALDLADVDLFEEIDMSKFEPEPEEERPPTPPPPTPPFFTSWEEMDEEERLAEVHLACMDCDVIGCAISQNLIVPDVEDSAAIFVARQSRWNDFREWYSEEKAKSEQIAKMKKENPTGFKQPASEFTQPRKLMLRNEAAAALNDETVIAAFNEDHPDKKRAVATDREKMNGNAPDMDFRVWYSRNREVRKEFLIRSANFLRMVRRAQMCFELYNFPEPVMFQPLVEPVPEGAPPVERRLRLFGSRDPETYTVEEVLFWHKDEELEDEISIVNECEERAAAERRRLAMLKIERKMQGLESEILMWEDHRSDLGRKVENILMNKVDEEGGFVGRFGYFDDIKKSSLVDKNLRELKFKHGTGLDNQDEFSDDKEKAKAEALAKDRRKEEERRRAENEKKRRAEEERKKKLEEERYERLRATADERKRIMKELKALKESRKKAAADKILADEKEKLRLEREARESELAAEVERRAELKREKMLRDAEAWREMEREKEMRSRESSEREAMGKEDGESRQWGLELDLMLEKKKARLELLKFAYLGVEGGRDEGEVALLWGGPKRFKPRVRRRHTDAYSVSHEEHIMEIPEKESIVVDKGVSREFLGLMGLRKRDLKMSKKPSDVDIWENKKNTLVRRDEKMGRKKMLFLKNQSAALLMGMTESEEKNNNKDGEKVKEQNQEPREVEGKVPPLSPIRIDGEFKLNVSPPGSREGKKKAGTRALTPLNSTEKPPTPKIGFSPLGSKLPKSPPQRQLGGRSKSVTSLGTGLGFEGWDGEGDVNVPFYREEFASITLSGKQHEAPVEGFKRQLNRNSRF